MAMNQRKNRAYELRLALLHQDTPASGFSGSRLSSVGSRFSGREGTILSSSSTRSPQPEHRGGRRRPHRLPQLGESDPHPGGDQVNHAVVSVTNLRLGSVTSPPLPPISSQGDRSEVTEVTGATRSRPSGPPPPPLTVIQQKQRQLRSELHVPRLLNDPSQEALVLQQLGDTSLQTFHYSRSAGDFVTAAALYNAALLQSDHDDDQKIRVRSRLIEAERQLLQNCSSCSSVVIEKYLAMDTGARDNKRLVHVRWDVKEALKVAQSRLDDLRTESESSDEVRIQFTEDMMNIAQMVQKTVVDVLQHIVTTCKAVLGEPPCRYAILAIGPLVAGHGDPYHMPLEYVVLVGDDTKPKNIEYFHNFCHYMHLKIINLGETSLFHCGVRTLDDPFNERFECFQDSHRKYGLHLDLSLNSSSITPLMCIEDGRLVPETDDRPASFLGAPWRIVGQLDESNTMSAGYGITPRLLHYTMIDGDKALLDDYKTEINHVLNRTEQETINYISFSCDLLLSVLQEPEPVAIINNGLSSLNKLQLEQDIELLPQIISALKVNHNVTSVHGWDVVESLFKRSVIGREDANSLKFASALSYYLTLKASKQSNYKSKTHRIDGSLTDGEIQTHVMGGLACDDSATTSWAVQQYYQILVPCWTCLYQQAKDYSRLSLVDCRLYNDNLKVHALAYNRLGDRSSAISVLETEVQEVSTLKHLSRPVLLYDLFTIQGLEYLHLGQHREARNCFNKTMELKEEIPDGPIKSLSFVNSWHNFGLLQLLVGKYDKALEQLTEGINLSIQVLTGHEQHKAKDQFEAGVYENIAHVQTCLGMLSGALKSFEISLRFREESSKTSLNIVSRDLHYRMGCLYLMQASHDIALRCLNEALDIHCYLSSKATHPNLWDAMILCQLSQVHDQLGNLTLSAAYKLQVQRVCTLLCSLLGVTANTHLMDLHLQAVSSLEALYELGKCLLFSGQTNLSLMVFECLQSRLEATTSHVKGKRAGVIDFAQVLLCKGDALHALEKVDDALSCYKQVLEACDRSYSSKGQPAYLLATCHKRLSTCYLDQFQHQEASENLDQALELYRFSYGETMYRLDICDVLKMQAACQRGEGKYEESMGTLQECLELEKKTFNELHIRVARCLYEMGLTYFAEGLYESAMNSYESAMKMYHKLDCDNCVEDLPKLYIGRAKCHSALGRIQQAERCWDRAVNKARSILEREPSKRKSFIRLMKLYADFYHQIEKCEQAIQIRNEVIQTYLSQDGMGEESPEVCAMFIAIGRDYSAAGITDEASQMFEKAIGLRRKFAEQEDEKLEIAGWLSELGQIYAKVGEQERSSECHLESLYLKRKVLGQGTVDEDVIASLETIAGVHEKRGELRQALALRKQSLAKNLQLHGQNVSAALVDTVERVASALQKLNEHDSALQHWQDALILRERLDKSDPPISSASHVYHQCGRCYEGLGQYKKAIEHYKKSLKLLQSDSEDVNRDLKVAVTIGDVGKSLNSLGQSVEAVENLMNASSNLRTIIDREGPEGEARVSLATVLRHLGLAYETCGQVEAAQEAYQEAVTLLDHLAGTDPSHEKAHCLHGLGNLHCTRGEYTVGTELLQQALTEYKLLTPDGGSKDIATTLEDLAAAQSGLQNDSQTLKYLNEALLVLRQVHGHKKPHLQVARCLGSVAAVCARAARHEDTVAYARQALSMYAAILPENADHPELVVLNELLGDCYWALGKYQDCLGFYKKASQVCLYLHNGDMLHSDVVNVMNKLQNVQRQLGRSH